jgi:hypothetical protein
VPVLEWTSKSLETRARHASSKPTRIDLPQYS